jgi:light-regulated signal transduction histidine kinase (bacteriophytochrome)
VPVSGSSALPNNGIELTQSTIKDFLRVSNACTQLKEIADGIGLAICGVVERHGGRLWLNSSQQQRQHFYFSIPDHQSMNRGQTSLTISAEPSMYWMVEDNADRLNGRSF